MGGRCAAVWVWVVNLVRLLGSTARFKKRDDAIVGFPPLLLCSFSWGVGSSALLGTAHVSWTLSTTSRLHDFWTKGTVENPDRTSLIRRVVGRAS